MITKERHPLPAVLDMGNGSFRVLIADVLADGSLEVLGVGEETAAGIDDGRIVDLDKAIAALRRVLRSAEIDAGDKRKVGALAVSVSGEYIKSSAGEGKTVIGSEPQRQLGAEEERTYQVSGGVVDAHDTYRVREMGVASVSSGDVEVLDVVEKTYSIDRQNNIRNPLGMQGKLLTGYMHLITAEYNSLQNMEKCIQESGARLVGKVVFSGLAAAQAVLSDEEKRLGVCLLDIGKQTTEMVIFHNGGVYETDVYLEASHLIDTDISAVHHTTLLSAEKCKKENGVATPSSGDETLPLVSTSGETFDIGRSLVLRTVSSRVEILLECVGNAVRAFEKSEGQKKLTAGIVLTGGGALLPGLPEMINARLQIPVRIGIPAYGGKKHERLKKPQFAAALGLLMMNRASVAEEQREPFMTRLKKLFFTPSSYEKEKHHDTRS